MGWFSRKPDTGPLWDHLSAMTPKRTAQMLDAKAKTAEDSTKFLEEMIFTILQTCGGSFLKGTGEYARDKLGKVNPDVIAFEGLSFCTYLVREYHLPTPADWDDEDEAETVVDAYRFAIAAMPHLVKKLTGWEVGDLWERRIMFWFNRKNMQDATEAFVGTLLTMQDVQLPAANYGRLSLDLRLNLELRGHVNSFAVTMPQAMAEAIQDTISEYGLAG